MIHKIKNKKGFTLVELLVVIAIIGILAVLAVPSLFKSIAKAKISDVEADYSAIKSAVLAEYAENGQLPYEIANQSFIDKYIDGGSTKTPLGGYYHIVPDYTYKSGEQDKPYINFGGWEYDKESKEFKYIEPGELQNKFKAILALRPYKANSNEIEEHSKLTESQFYQLGRDLGYQNIFLSNKDFKKDGMEIYLGLIDK